MATDRLAACCGIILLVLGIPAGVWALEPAAVKLNPHLQLLATPTPTPSVIKLNPGIFKAGSPLLPIPTLKPADSPAPAVSPAGMPSPEGSASDAALPASVSAAPATQIAATAAPTGVVQPVRARSAVSEKAAFFGFTGLSVLLAVLLALTNRRSIAGWIRDRSTDADTGDQA